MIKLLSADQLREADKYTIAHEPIASIDLMEKAAEKICDWIKNNVQTESFSIFCGPGNNGADGLAVARLLNFGSTVVYICSDSEKFSDNFLVNLERLKKKRIEIIYIKSVSKLPDLKRSVIIDALLGSGLNREINDFYKPIISLINNSGFNVISIDVPSGLSIDSPSGNSIVKSAFTLTIGLPKIAFLYPETGIYAGKVIVLDIGLSKEYIQNVQTSLYITEMQDVCRMLKFRNPFSHKGTYGHALLFAGSEGKYGAALLAAEACMRAGAGMISCLIPEEAVAPLNARLPEAMTVNQEYLLKNITGIAAYNIIAAGPGLGTAENSASLIKQLLQNYRKPLLLDADALNIISENKTWLSFLPPQSVLTPHPGEFYRLTGKSNNSYERTERQIEFSLKYSCYVILKDHYTSISTPQGKIYFNSTGNAGMATAGSGDVLAGFITGLMAQDYTPFEACICGVYLHGLAGDYGAEQNGMNALIASDIIKYSGKAFSDCYSAIVSN
jgi:hydroxyethylthiazole kinase-like uncharacterized protein yjeF